MTYFLNPAYVRLDFHSLKKNKVEHFRPRKCWLWGFPWPACMTLSGKDFLSTQIPSGVNLMWPLWEGLINPPNLGSFASLLAKINVMLIGSELTWSVYCLLPAHMAHSRTFPWVPTAGYLTHSTTPGFNGPSLQVLLTQNTSSFSNLTTLYIAVGLTFMSRRYTRGKDEFLIYIPQEIWLTGFFRVSGCIREVRNRKQGLFIFRELPSLPTSTMCRPMKDSQKTAGNKSQTVYHPLGP